jgi:hypothetical protein
MVGGMTSSSGTSDPAIPPPVPPVTRLTARSPEDLLAVVPVVLGFVPEESVVMLTFGAGHPFHARVDLPRSAEDLAEVVDVLRAPAVAHRVSRVVFVVYAQQPAPAARAADALVWGFHAVGIDVLDVLRADRHRWHPLLRPRPGIGPEGVPYDVGAHPFTAQAVLDGRVTLGSRAELAASLEPHPERVAALAAARASLPRRSRGDDERWARDLVRRCVTGAEVPEDAEVARLLVAVGRPGPRAAVWALMTRTVAPAHVGFWTDVVRRAPDDLLATPAALLAFAAWLAGHGALAWCAVDRSQAVQPDHALAARVAGLLVDAVAPHEWEERRPPGGGGRSPVR